MLPQLFLDRMKQMLEEEYPAFLNSYEDARYQALRINPSKQTWTGLQRKLPFICSRCRGKRTGFITKRKISRENIRITRRACTIFRSRVPWHRLHIWMRSRAKKFWIYVRHRGAKVHRLRQRCREKGSLSAMRFIQRGQRFFPRTWNGWV